MRPITTDLSFFKKFKITKKSHDGSGPKAILAADDQPLAAPPVVEPTQKVPEEEVLEMIIKHPGMNASAFYNNLKSKGMKIIKEAARIREGGPGSGRYPKGSGKGGKSKKDPTLTKDEAKAYSDIGAMMKKAFGFPDISAEEEEEREKRWEKIIKKDRAYLDREKKKSKKESDIKEGGPGSGRYPAGSKGNSQSKSKIKKQAWDDSVKDTPEYDVRKAQKKVDKIKAQLDKLKAEYKAKFGVEYKRKESWHDRAKNVFKDVKKKAKEADSSSANVQMVRANESGQKPISILSRFVEGAARDNGVGHTKFRVVLIQEGLGNLKDSYYYTRQALESAVPVFEGKKIYADHPTAVEEQTRPERSVKDVLGHFEQVSIQEGEAGQAQLVADVVILPDEPYRWARSLMSHSVEYAKKYPDKDFVGLSINASGDAEAKPLTEIMAMGVPESAKIKLQKAAANGVEIVRMVTSIKEAISCDLVTEAGAGGKILEMIEKEKKMGKKKEALKESEATTETAEKKETIETPAPTQTAEVKEAAGEKHEDVEQDKALIKKMIAEYLGDEESSSEEVMQMCKEAYESYVEMGYEADEAMKATGHAMRLAKHLASKETDDMGVKDEEKPEMKDEKKVEESNETAETNITEVKAETTTENTDAVKESSIQLAAEVSVLREELKAMKLERHIEKTLSESGFRRETTALFKEKAGEIKNIQDFDTKFKLFCETYRAVKGSETNDFAFVVSTEKREKTKGIITFEDCVS